MAQPDVANVTSDAVDISSCTWIRAEDAIVGLRTNMGEFRPTMSSASATGMKGVVNRKRKFEATATYHRSGGSRFSIALTDKYKAGIAFTMNRDLTVTKAQILSYFDYADSEYQQSLGALVPEDVDTSDNPTAASSKRPRPGPGEYVEDIESDGVASDSDDISTTDEIEQEQEDTEDYPRVILKLKDPSLISLPWSISTAEQVIYPLIPTCMDADTDAQFSERQSNALQNIRDTCKSILNALEDAVTTRTVTAIDVTDCDDDDEVEEVEVEIVEFEEVEVLQVEAESDDEILDDDHYDQDYVDGQTASKHPRFDKRNVATVVCVTCKSDHLKCLGGGSTIHNLSKYRYECLQCGQYWHQLPPEKAIDGNVFVKKFASRKRYYKRKVVPE